MIKIIDDRASGKTGRLFLIAKECDGVIVCKNPNTYKSKANGYGIVGIEFMSYMDYLYKCSNKILDKSKKYFIDELDQFFVYCDLPLDGFNLSK